MEESARRGASQEEENEKTFNMWMRSDTTCREGLRPRSVRRVEIEDLGQGRKDRTRFRRRPNEEPYRTRVREKNEVVLREEVLRDGVEATMGETTIAGNKTVLRVRPFLSWVGVVHSTLYRGSGDSGTALSKARTVSDIPSFS